MVQLYPDPPHLVVGLYSAEPDNEAFAGVCETVEALGGVPSGVVEVAPRDRDFEYPSDLAGASEVLRVDPARRASLVNGHDSRLRVVRSEYTHPSVGTLIAEYLPGAGQGRHPVGISLSAESLGIPEPLWSPDDRRDAYSLASWTTSFLQAATARCGALYGIVGVEATMPTPEDFRSGSNGWEALSTLLFVSTELLNTGDDVETRLRRAFAGGDVTRWSNGIVLSGWSPFNSARVNVDDPDRVGQLAVEALRQALSH